MRSLSACIVAGIIFGATSCVDVECEDCDGGASTGNALAGGAGGGLSTAMGAGQPNGGADGGDGGDTASGGGDGGGASCGGACTSECVDGHCIYRLYDLYGEAHRLATFSGEGGTRVFVVSKGESQSAVVWNLHPLVSAYPTIVAETDIQGDPGFLLPTTGKEALYSKTTAGIQRCYFNGTLDTACSQLTAAPTAAGMRGTSADLIYVDPTAQRLAKLDASGITLLDPPLPDFPPAAGIQESEGFFFIAMTGGAIVRAKLESSGSLALVTTSTGFGEVAPELSATSQFVYFRAKIPPNDRYGVFRLPLDFAPDDPAEPVCGVMVGPEARTIAAKDAEILFDYEVSPGTERLVRIAVGSTLPTEEQCVAATHYRGYYGESLIGAAGFVDDAAWFSEGTVLYRVED